jgi:hypothetical protein
MITITRPNEFQQEYLIDTPMPHRPSLRQKLVHKSSTILRKTFIAPLSWSSPRKLPGLCFKPDFGPPNLNVQNVEIKDLGHQEKCIAFFDRLIDKMLEESSPDTGLQARQNPSRPL